MGRKRSIDRDALLDAAEAIVAEEGPGRLTFDALAARAGVSKGGVLYCFASKQDLVAAMQLRDMERFAAEVARRREAGEEDELTAHLVATRDESDAMAARAASLMASLVESSARAPIGDFYRRWLERLDTGKAEDGNRRLAFLAAEAAYLLRGMGLVTFSDKAWNELFGEIVRLAETEKKS